MLGLDKLVGVDAYSRNKKLLNEIGVQYLPVNHRRYIAWLVIKNKEEISLKQCLMNLDATNALALKDSETYFHWKDPKIKAGMDNANYHNHKKVERKNGIISEVFDAYVQSLEEATEEKLSIELESNYTEQVTSETEMRKYIGQTCHQVWRLKNERNNKTARIL